MTDIFHLRVRGIPETKGSWRSVGGKIGGRGGGKRRLIPDNPKSAAWESTIAWLAKSEVQRRTLHVARCRRDGLAYSLHDTMSIPTSNRVGVSLVFVLPPPPNKSKKNRRDIDKLARLCLDALTKVVYLDDEQVDSLEVDKVIEPSALEWGVTIRVYLLDGESPPK